MFNNESYVSLWIIVVCHIIFWIVIKNCVKREFFLFISRQLEGHETFYIVLNVGTEQEAITLNEHFKDVPLYMIVRTSSINSWHAEK